MYIGELCVFAFLSFNDFKKEKNKIEAIKKKKS